MKPELKELLKEWFKEDGSREYLRTMFRLREEALREKASEEEPHGIYKVYRSKTYNYGTQAYLGEIVAISYFKNRRDYTGTGINIDNNGELCKYPKNYNSKNPLIYDSWEKLITGLKRNNISINLTNFRNALVEKKIIGKRIKIS